ncbi:MAG: GNAT family N-acetyltransferase [Myxococcales bacterium]|nr:GNAT family N-acetyltransferase [Myxococcales bacterium]
MESFRIDGGSARDYAIRVEEVSDITPDLVRTLIEIDLQTFAESTYSPYTAAAFLKCGRVFLLRADDRVIGTCVCMRGWERPNEAMILSMGIRPGWRGRGLGQRFVQGVLDRLTARGLRSCCLLVGRDNRRAVRVYEDVGFRVVEERDIEPQHNDVLCLMRAILHSEDAPVISLT